MKTLFVLLVALLLIQNNYAQWNYVSFTDARVLLSADKTGNNAVLGGWKNPLATGKSYYSVDGGNTWNAAQVPDSLRAITGLKMINGNLVYACGAKNLVMPSKEEQIIPEMYAADPEKYSLYKKGIFTDKEETYKGWFLQSVNGGVSWQPKGTLPDSVNYLVSMVFTSEMTGYVLALGPGATRIGILKTTDGGTTWNWIYRPSPGTRINAFSFCDEMNGIIAATTGTNDGLMLKTTNGGASWESTFLMDNRLMYIKLITPSKVITLAESSPISKVVLVSTNGGTNWTGGYSFSTDNLFIDGVDGIDGGWMIVYGTLYPTGSSTPFVYGTLDNGLTWIQRTLTPVTDITMTSSVMLNYSEWYITGTYMITTGFILKTTNNGGLPVELASFTASQVNNIVTLDWITATELNNYGFEVERKSPSTEYISIGFVKGNGTTTEQQNYSFMDNLQGTSGKFSYRLKQIDFDGSYSYSNEIDLEILNVPENSIPTEYSLLQNYPNPFNPSTTISFELPEASDVSLKIFDLLGREKSEVLNEFRNAGRHNVTFDASTLPAGVYFYELRAGDFSGLKKMVLLK
jgi:hypothetical protein